jgi:nicotinamidase-related amidase
MRDTGLDVSRGLAEVCRPDRLALVVYDMQVGIVSQMKGATAILPKVDSTLAVARAGGFRVIFTRHLSMPKKLMGRFQLRQAMAWQRTNDPDQTDPGSSAARQVSRSLPNSRRATTRRCLIRSPSPHLKARRLRQSSETAA